MKGLLVDLDDTLYDYAPAEHCARRVASARIAADTGLSDAAVAQLYDASRQRVKARLGDRGSSHSRLLYFVELAHAVGRTTGASTLARVRTWERVFWDAFIQSAVVHPGARELLRAFRQAGGKVAMVTDLVAHVQLDKVEAWELFPLLDAIVISEEVERNKPAPAIFELAAERIGVPLSACVMVGDNDAKDGEGARSLGIPFYLARSSEHQTGLAFEEIAQRLGLQLELGGAPS